jgi:hypothetical protein
MVGELPMTVTGKAQNFKMREIAVVELDLAVTARGKTA